MLEVARPAWMRCSFIDAVLTELAVFAAGSGTNAHVIVCDNFTALTRSAGGKSVQIGVARDMAKRWAAEVGSSRSVVTMVNHNNTHWCAARILFDETVVEMYDPLPRSKQSDRATQFSFSLLKLLGNAILAQQGGGEEADFSRQ